MIDLKKYIDEIKFILKKDIAFGKSKLVTVGIFDGKQRIVKKLSAELVGDDIKFTSNCDQYFEIGSITKIFTAILILNLKFRGKIKLEKPVSYYLSNWRNGYLSKISVLEILLHKTCLPTNPNFGEYSYEERYFSQFDKNTLLKWVNEFPCDQESEFVYSNLNYFVLGLLIEELHGKTFKEVIIEELLNPLFMEKTKKMLFEVPKMRGYTQGLEEVKAGSYGCFFSSGGIISTMDEMMRFCEFLIYPSRFGKKDSFKNEIEKYVYKTAHGYNQTIGFAMEAFNGNQVLFKGGETLGFTGILGVDLKREMALCSLNNLRYGNEEIFRRFFFEGDKVSNPDSKEFLIENFNEYLGEYTNGEISFKIRMASFKNPFLFVDFGYKNHFRISFQTKIMGLLGLDQSVKIKFSSKLNQLYKEIELTQFNEVMHFHRNN